MFLGLDAVWLGTMAGSLYKPRLGAPLPEQPDLLATRLFYALSVAGVVAFAAAPAWPRGETLADWSLAAPTT
ncbi:MAG: hypothetical protein BGP12_21210 [Rhodospirillales bacterium 70-18]|nr:DUF2177 family protein [Rhodospirillales bacterium]OJY70275.1 MAG: hypothetical protein BGP12_21210 [Rhodospirillales bacterium 70-18]